MNLRQIPKVCDHIGCNKVPTKQICVSLAVHANHPPAISTPIAYTCDEHQSLFTFDQFVDTADNWEKICKQFADIGRMSPKKEFSKILIEDIYEAKNENNNRVQ